MDKVYYLPDEDSELPLGDLKNNNKQYIGCIKQYESLGEIKKIRIEFGENVSKPIDIVNFSKTTDEIDIKENLVTYKAPKNIPGVILTCTYQTPAETTFYTKRQISFVIRQGTKTKKLSILNTKKDKTINQHVDNSTSWIVIIVVTVFLSCIIMIIVAHIIVSKTKKREVKKSSSLSYSGSSSLSKSDNKGPSGMSSIKQTTASQGNDSFNLIVLKYGKDSKTSTSSSNVTGNPTSTSLDNNYFKNVKSTAK
uniref:Uncharacterized protein n=1 Tax=Strongyloides papillosus TaxID=174720 RepID=A0A0N5BG27_STREA